MSFFLQVHVQLVDCLEIPRENLEELSSENCAALFNIFTSNVTLKSSSDDVFQYNLALKTRHLQTDQYYPECPSQDEWNSNDIRQKILDWKSSLFNNEHLHWFHNSSSEPLDLSNPKIEITFDQLVGRKGFERRKVIYLIFNCLTHSYLWLRSHFSYKFFK